MNQRFALCLGLLLGLLSSACLSTASAHAEGPRLVHNVFFTLRDDNEATRAALVQACYDSLGQLPGVVAFHAGVREESLQGAANDREFDVALAVVFEDRAAHDQYLTAPEHLAFVDAQKANWQQVRVFDSRAARR